MFNFKLKKIDKKDKDLILEFLKNRWGSEKIVYNKKVFLPHKLPGFIVEDNQKLVGLITYKKYKDFLWIITLDSLIEKKGIGTALINAVKKEAKNLGIKKIKLRTTNDNLNALRFYQKRGFRLSKIYKEAVTRSRAVKPEIPLTGENGIPLADEIELEMSVY